MATPRDLVFSGPAETDLAGIWDYIATDNIATADNVVRRIHERLNHLCDFPFSARFDPRFDAHLLPLPPYIIAYTVDDDAIRIVRIIHGRRDIEGIFHTSRNSEDK